MSKACGAVLYYLLYKHQIFIILKQLDACAIVHYLGNYLSCPFHTTGCTSSRGYRCSLAVEPPPRWPHFVRVVHTTDGVIHGYMHSAKHPCPSTTV